MALLIYALCLTLATPLIWLRLLWRGRQLPGYRRHIGERWGYYSGPASRQPTLWVHAVSVGETRAAAPVGKIMRKLEPELVQAARQALEEQHKGSATEKMQLHLAEHWRDRLIADDDALAPWMAEHPTTDTQQLRALIRQARKDAQPAGKEANVQVAQGLAPRKGRAYRELFQLVREHLGGTGADDASDIDEDHGDE